MSKAKASFGVGIDFKHVLAAISKQIYETPLAFIRENVQNAVDAVRIQALRDGKLPSDENYRVEITVTENECRIRDNGIGMSPDDLRELFWTIGASGKRNDEARQAGCVGMFGIGGFANLGVCDTLTVVSQTQDSSTGTATWLSEKEIREAGSSIPQVQTADSADAAPRGTIVSGTLRERADIKELDNYLADFVRFAEERIYFNGKLVSRNATSPEASVANLRPLGAETTWTEGSMSLTGALYVGAGHVLFASLKSLTIGDRPVRLSGFIRFENGPLDVFKRGFKLCATKVQTIIGVSGRIDCDTLSPTAGRDSLDAESLSLVAQIATLLERVAVEAVLTSTELLEQHGRVLQYVVRHGWARRLDNLLVSLADGTDSTLGSVKTRSGRGVGVYYGANQKHALSQIMQARGNLVVVLPTERYRQQAVRDYLDSHCAAKSFSGVVEVAEPYTELDRFEKLFMSELETNVIETYEVRDARLSAGKLTEDIPVFLREAGGGRPVEIFVDVRHSEIAKLKSLGVGPLLYSMIAAFCREYLGSSLRKRSPKFFGSGAVNLELLAKKRSELWVLLKEEIQTISKRTEKQVMRRSDVHTVRAGGAAPADERPAAHSRRPKLLRIEGEETFADILGYYIRIPDGATSAFGDVIKEYDSRAAVWAGNKILFVASDAVSSAFQFEIRTDHLIITPDTSGGGGVEGAAELRKPVQEMNDGLYFPIPDKLVDVLVPQGDAEIRIEVSSGDWIDLKTSNAWQSKAGG